MKVYISADIEGVTGCTYWSETILNNPEWIACAEQMTKETVAAVEGAMMAGADEIYVQDAHDSTINIDINKLPQCVNLIRGWSGDPMCMTSGLDSTFDAAIFIGYHSGAGSEASPLAHTMNPDDISCIKINNRIASEFLIHGYAAALNHVPVAFVSGDKGLMDEVNELNKNIYTLGVKSGIGGSTINMNPNKAVEEIKRLTYEALNDKLQEKILELPKSFNVEIEYKEASKAYTKSFYPGAELIGPRTVLFKTKYFYEVLRMLLFLA